MALAVKSEASYAFNTGKQVFPFYDESQMLFPEARGDPDRVYTSLNRHEKMAKYATIAAEQFERRTWTVNTSVLTYVWPKLKMAPGVRVLKGSVKYSNITPFTNVPMRGVVRFMTQSSESWSLAIAQKGIGAEFHMQVMDGPEGPAILDGIIDDFTEAANLTMALMVATGLVNTAHQSSLNNANEPSFKKNYGQKLAKDLAVYGSAGADPNRLVQIVEKELREHPEFDTVLLPDGCDFHFNNSLTSVEVKVPVYGSVQGRIIEYESKQTIKSIASIKNGRVRLFEMPVFSIWNRNRTVQVLETEVIIGEVYCEEESQRFEQSSGRRYSAQNEDVYLYDQPGDSLKKVRFDDAVQNSFIWDAESGKYHESLINYVERLNRTNKDPDDTREAEIPLQYPIMKIGRTFHLPEFIGSLSTTHLPESVLDEMIVTATTALTIGEQNRALFSDATGDMDTLNRLRESIEDLPYDADSFEQIAKANIDRSMSRDANGRLVFVGELTPNHHVGENLQVLTEWSPNSHGGLDIPRTAHPIGYFSAAGLRTLAATPTHPFSADASVGYSFLQMLVGRLHEIFPLNPLRKKDLVMPHLHRIDEVQGVMDALFGHRLPLFLAAPEALVSSNVNEGNLPSMMRDGDIVFGTGNPNDGLVRTDAAGWTYFESPSGVLFSIQDKRQPPLASIKNIDIFLSDNVGNLVLELGNEEPANLSEPKKAEFKTNVITLRRLLISKIITSDRENTAKDLISAFIGIFKNFYINGELDQFNLNIRTYFVEAVPMKKAIAEAWKQGFSELVKSGQGQMPDVDEFYGLIKEYVNDNTYNRLPVSQQKSADRDSEAYRDLLTRMESGIALLDSKDRNNKFFYSTEDITIAGRINLRTMLGKSNKQDALAANANIQKILTAMSITGSVTGINVVSSSIRDANVIDVATAYFFRAPLNATMRVVRDITKIEYPWVLPADVNQFLNTYVENHKNLSDADLVDYHFLVNSQGGFMSSSGGSDQADFYFDYLRLRSPSAYKAWLDISSEMNKRLAYVRYSYQLNLVKRLLGIAIILTPHYHLGVLKRMVKSGVRPPFSLLHWRLESKGLFGDAIVMIAGSRSGLVLWNHAEVRSAIDNVRAVGQLRATIDTDAHPIRARNHRLIGPCQPRGYIGGHNTRLVDGPHALMEGADEYRPSVISTVVPLYHIETRMFPISFTNNVPAMIDRQNNKALDPNPKLQYWTGGDYYGKNVYRSYFGEDLLSNFDGPSKNMELYEKHTEDRNHLAFRGYQARFDPISGYYSREVIGNGHRSDPRMNNKGARSYFNNEVPVLSSLATLGDLRLT